MSGLNGAKPQADPALLTANDLKRAKVALGGRSPHELLAEPETMFEVLVYCFKSRTDPSFTWEQAGDVPLGEVFDMSGGEPPPPPGGTPGSPGPEPATKKPGSSKARRASSAPAPSSAASTASPATSSTS